VVLDEKQRYGKNKDTQIDKTYIDSAEYRRKFDKITDDSELNRIIYFEAKKILKHRSGTEFEDLAFVSTEDGKVLCNSTFAETELSLGKSEEDVIKKVLPTVAMKNIVKNAEPHSVIAIHNHPGSALPSLSDLHSARVNKYKSGIILAHDGTIYKYHVLDNAQEGLADYLLDSLARLLVANDSEKVVNLLAELADYGIYLEVI
jgi:proteasome lid subunit RPN8/RPN11